VLEELDKFKKGNNVLNQHAREFIRRLDRLSEHSDLREWLPLNGDSRGKVRVLSEVPNNGDDPTAVFGERSNDHRIIASAYDLAQKMPDRPVILVSKDINLRVKARTLGLESEDYETVRIADVERLYRGHSEIELDDDEPVERLFSDDLPISPSDLGLEEATCHHYFILRGPTKSGLAIYDSEEDALEPVYKGSAYGIVPRNAEQTFALDAILRPEVSLVTLSGSAGTGKTLLALAGALEQRRRFRQVYLARPIVPLSYKDIGYLPGDVNSKVSPYMQPLWDNLNVIKDQFSERNKEYRRIDEMVEHEKLRVVPLAYIRGRSFSNIIFIVDEAQNLSPHEIKTIITRAAQGTKIVFTGDIFQIDTPYLDSQSNGLSYLIDRMKGHPLYAHVNLEKGERSELANAGSELL
jgi:PhoH-like ATPase